MNDTGLIQQREKYFEKLSLLFDNKEGDNLFFVNGIKGKSEIDPYKEPEQWIEDVLNSLGKEAERIVDPLVFRPLCVEFGPYGVHFIDKIFGAEVYQDETTKQWYNKYLAAPVGQLEYPDIEKDETWLLAQRAAKAFLQQKAALPLFGLPTIASPLNIAVNLYGQEILIALSLEPEEAVHDLEIINRLLCDIHKWYINNIPSEQLQPVISWLRTQPHGYGQICGCTTQLISGQLYRQYIAPLDDELLSLYPNGGMIHLCGSHVQHIPVWREMKSLRAVQLNDRAAADLETYYRELREDQILYLQPCKEMSVEQAMDITGGKRLVIMGSTKQCIKIRG